MFYAVFVGGYKTVYSNVRPVTCGRRELWQPFCVGGRTSLTALSVGVDWIVSRARQPINTKLALRLSNQLQVGTDAVDYLAICGVSQRLDNASKFCFNVERLDNIFTTMNRLCGTDLKDVCDNQREKPCK